MSILDKIIEAKEKIGDEAALRIAEHYHVEQFDETKLKGCCPFHHEKTPSFIWSHKDLAYSCFACGKRFGILDLYIETEGSYKRALKRLFRETGIDCNLNDLSSDNEKSFEDFKFPHEESNKDRSQVEAYMEKRGISKETLDYAGVKQDAYGNCVFELRDLDGRLMGVKYRPSHSIKKGQPKMWWQKNADMYPLLYNLMKVDISKPLLICEGFSDCLSVIEAGWTNVTSIPGGAEDLNWIEANYDFLQNVENIILWFDNDKAGETGRDKVLQRLGEYRCKIVKPDQDDIDAVSLYYAQYKVECTKTDANNILLSCGKNRVLALIEGAEEVPSKKLKYLMDCKPTSVKDMEKTSMGIKGLDAMLYGNLFPCFTIYSGRSGCVDADTEFFDGKGWKRIADYEVGDKVLEYNIEKDFSVLSYPLNYIKKPCDTLYQIGGHKGIQMVLSPEHNVLWYDRDNNPHKDSFENIMKKHDKLVNGFTGKIKGCFNYSGKGIDLTDEQIKIMCAVICDGSLYYDNREGDFSNWKSNDTVRFHIKKERKKERLRELFDEADIEYRENQSAAEGYTDFYITAPRHEKEFTSYWYDCNQHQLQVICDNILFWDGHTGKTSDEFSTTSKQTADFVQFAFSSCGKIATIQSLDRRGRIRKVGNKEYPYKSIEYCVTINKKQFYRVGGTIKNEKAKGDIIPVKTIDGYKYCFTMPLGTLVLRKNRRIFISFNSGKSSITNTTSLIAPIESGYKTFVFSGELGSGQLADWILSPLAGYNHIKEVYAPQSPERPFFVVTDKAQTAIQSYYRKNILVYNDEHELDTSGDSLFMAMEEAYRRYGCKVFLIDNLMCVSFENLNEDSKWDSQKQFIIRLMDFTNRYNVCTNLIIHPKKMSIYSKTPTTEDLHGASEMGNLCHRMLWVDRLNPDESTYNTRITVIKDRPTQAAGRHCELYYDEKTRRIYTDLEEQRKVYSWEKSANIKYTEEEDSYLIYHKPIVALPSEDSNYVPPM